MKKNILVFAHESGMNGASHSLLLILKSLNTVYDFLVIVPQLGLFTQQLDSMDVRYRILDVPRSGTFHKLSKKEYITNYLLFRKTISAQVQNVLKIIDDFQPDAVYTNTSVLHVGYYTAKKLKIAHIWHIREYGDFNFKINYFPSLTHTKKLMCKSKTVVFTTNLLKKHWYGASDKNSKIIYNSFDKIGNETHRNTIDNGEIKIGLVGYFIRGKGQLEALDILQRLLSKGISAHLYFYGDFSAKSAYFAEIMAEAEQNDLVENVSFCGYKSHDEIYSNIKFLFNCASFEAFGRTLIEAMSYGIPVISKNSGGPQEIITHLEDGFLYDTNDEAVSHIINCLNNESQYKMISERARTKVKTKFGNEKYIKSMNEIFKNA